MLEKRFYAVPPQQFTADGTTRGVITIAATTSGNIDLDACSLFKVKQRVYVCASGLPNLELEVKEIDNVNNIQVGPIPNGKPGVNTSIDARTDISAYTVAKGAFVFANEQRRPDIDYAEFMRAVYDEEPTVALRTVLVDQCGDRINGENPLPVTVDGGTITISPNVNIHDQNGNPYTPTNPLPVEIEDANLNVTLGTVRITACDNDPVAGDVHSSIRISDCTNDLCINDDGSINVHIVPCPVVPATVLPGLSVYYNEVSNVANAVETTILSVTVPVGPDSYRLTEIETSGTNIATYRVYINNAIIVEKRSWWFEFDITFAFEGFLNGIILNPGDNVKVTVTQYRPVVGTFEATADIDIIVPAPAPGPAPHCGTCAAPTPVAPAASLTTLFNQASAVVANVETTILTLIVPTGPAYYRVTEIETSGQNIALYRVKVNGTTNCSKRSWWAHFNDKVTFADFVHGLLLQEGDVLTVTVFHTRPRPANFNATVYYEVDTATPPAVVTSGLTVNYNEVIGVVSGVETNLISITVPVATTMRVTEIEVSGENIAQYKVKVNGNTIETARTWWTRFDAEFNFVDYENGLLLNSGDVLTVTVLYNRPQIGNFEVTVLSDSGT
jgi:hypothetical protein